MSASRQCQLSHVSHEYVTQSPNPYQHHLQVLGNYNSWCKPAGWHEMTSAPPPDHLTPLPCLLSSMNWLPHPHLILSDPSHAYVPAPPSRYASAVVPPYLPPHFLPSLHSHGSLKIFLQCRHLISALTPPYASTPPLLNMLILPLHP
ncbi:hypothetical protein O181_022912 [Austropuccinia psidii MF-1]|uniref:Uncharacterized protein n=1 Tax=Austropuccinia psidii MF-1 TaxID=1389203 RepID=A0A9Q3CII5_9BASI|nr:hypothetical protein [Austropuccinia psidii MF-1]